MKFQLDKSEFLKNEVEFLGFVISANGIKTNPKKVKTICDMPDLRNLKELRSLLGMTSYYRRFIYDYAKITKSLTALLRGEKGFVSKRQSMKVPVILDEKAKEAIVTPKNTLISKDVILTYPDFDKEFELTTDASDYVIGAIGARTLQKAEEY